MARGQGGRPRASDGVFEKISDAPTTPINMRVTPHERFLIEATAAARGYQHISSYMRDLLLLDAHELRQENKKREDHDEHEA